MSDHCRRLAAGAAWPDAEPGSVYALSTGRFDVSISVLGRGQHPGEPVLPGEEVGAVLEGSFHIAAAGESYELSTGEGIVIPPGAPRRWTCTAGRGVLYRVIVTAPAGPES